MAYAPFSYDYLERWLVSVTVYLHASYVVPLVLIFGFVLVKTFIELIP